MKNTIICQMNDKGVHTFYLLSEGEQYFLFNQNYRKGVHEYFGRGVILEEAINFKKSHNDTSLIKTMDKIPMYLKHLENEYCIAILDRTKLKKNKINKNAEVRVA